MKGTWERAHALNVTVPLSLFDAAYRAREEWCVFWWLRPDPLIGVRSRQRLLAHTSGSAQGLGYRKHAQAAKGI